MTLRLPGRRRKPHTSLHGVDSPLRAILRGVSTVIVSFARRQILRRAGWHRIPFVPSALASARE